MVQLYLIRHGVADARGGAGADDRKRPLSDQGAKQMRKAARGLARLGADLDLVLTSPLVRAEQTAEIVAAAFDNPPPVVTTPALGPKLAYTALLSTLAEHAGRERIALVGHEPSIGDIARRLTKFGRRLEFRKGAVCRIDVDALPPIARGDLRWFVTPAILRAVKG